MARPEMRTETNGFKCSWYGSQKSFMLVNVGKAIIYHPYFDGVYGPVYIYTHHQNIVNLGMVDPFALLTLQSLFFSTSWSVASASPAASQGQGLPHFRCCWQAIAGISSCDAWQKLRFSQGGKHWGRLENHLRLGRCGMESRELVMFSPNHLVFIAETDPAAFFFGACAGSSWTHLRNSPKRRGDSAHPGIWSILLTDPRFFRDPRHGNFHINN